MKNLIKISVLALFGMLAACGQFDTTTTLRAQNCTVSKVGSVATIKCANGTVTTLVDGTNGVNGTNGQDGATGAQGPQGIAGQDGAQGLQGVAGQNGTNGQDGVNGTNGTNGSNGTNGQNGTNGVNGHSSLISIGVADVSVCPNGGSLISVGLDLNDDHTLSLSETTQVATICNGINGTNGLNGANGTNGTNGQNAAPTPFTPVGIIAPCAVDPMHPTAAELSNPDLEVFLQLSNGTVLDSFSENISGYNTHFGVLSNGYYMSTGAGNCTFHYNNGILSH